MSTWDATLWIGVEAAVIAIAGAALGASAVRLRVLALVVIAHALAATAAWWLADGPGDGAAVARVRILLSAELLTAWAAAAALVRLGVDRGSAAAAVALLMLALVIAPAPGEAFAQADGDSRARTLAHAASPAFAAATTLGLDVLHDRALYGRLPAAAMEMHMTPWIWTTGAYLLAATLLSLLALRRRPRRSAALAAVLVALVATGCKKDEAKKKEAPAPDKASKDAGAAPAPADADQPATPVTKAATAQDVQKAIDAGIAFLAKSRTADGLIGGHPGTTALATWAIASAEGAPPADDPLLKPSLDALVKLAKPDGGIWDKDYPVYVTAISVLALQRAKVEPALIEKAQRWLADKQFANQDGMSETNVNYGGIGYGVDEKHPDADLSNLHFALDALQASTLKDRPEVLARAQKFLERCQNRTESNDQDWAANDGGFVYKPGVSKAGGTTSSASMTYAAVASFVYAEVDAKDPRLTAALDWLRANYSVDENPGLGQKGLYYHFHMMGRTLGLLGQRTVVDTDEQSHDWPVELATKLVSLQKPDGSWANPEATYWEDNPAIATSRAVLALEHALAAMK